MHYSDIYKTIKLRRDDLKISQEQVSKLSGVGLRTLKQLESGKGNPNIKTLQNICDVLGMEICIRIRKV